MNVPLSKIYVDEEIKKAVLDVLDSGRYILGENVRAFEEKFASFCGVKHAICVSSGTAAAFLTLKALSIGAGDEVIVPSFSFIATASPIVHVGAKLVFAEINLRNYTIDVEDIKRKISRKTKAIIPVHLYGHPADMDPLLQLAKEKSIFVIEDACQAHGAQYKGKKVGGLGISGFFSFYPSKNLTVCGDGGMITTNDDALAEKLRMLRDHGRKEKYSHELIGYNMRFNEVQAAVGIKQLEKLAGWNDARRKIAQEYTRRLSETVITPVEEAWAKAVYHMYVIRSKKRDGIQKFLAQVGVSTGIHYPIPIHRQPAIVSAIGATPRLDKTDEVASTVLSLPMYPQLADEQVDYICSKITEFGKGGV